MSEWDVIANIGSERAVLAGICQFGKDAFVDVTDIVDVNTFTSQTNQIIFRCLEETLDSSDVIDIPSILAAATTLSLLESLTKDKKSEEFLRSLMNFPVKLPNVRPHARKIAVLEVARMAQVKHKDAWRKLQEVNGNESIDEILSISEGPIFELSNNLNKGREEGAVKIGEGALEELIDLMDNPVEMAGIPTPFKELNASIGGGLRTGVTLFGARPKTGKTTIGTEIGLHIAKNLEIPVLYLDTEMNKTSVRDKILSNISHVPWKLIETGQCGNNPKNRQAVVKAANDIDKMTFFYRRVAGKEFDEVLSIMRRWIYQHVGFDETGKANPHVVVYDYFKLMSTKSIEGMKEYEALGYQISNLSDFCGDYNTPVLGLVQLNKLGEISQSDRLLWLCISYTSFREKVAEEIAEDGPQNGNRILLTEACRFGIPMKRDADYINLMMDGDIAKVTELSTKKRPIGEAKSPFEKEEGDEPF